MAFLFVDSFLNHNNGRLLQKSIIRALELLLLSAGLMSTLVMVKSALFPYSCEIVLSNLMEIWNSIKCLLSSHLYICIIINFMVVLIAASSTLHHHEIENQDDPQDSESPASPPPPADDAATCPPPPPPPPPALVFYKTLISEAHEIEKTLYPLNDDSRDLREPVIENEHKANTNLSDGKENDDDEDTMEARWRSITRSPPPPPPPPPAAIFYETLIPKAHEIEKTLYPLNDHSGDLREPVIEKEHEANTNLSDDKENDDEDTMEATWRSITGGGKRRPQRKQLKKSETWDVPPPQNNVSVRRKELRKSETFNDTVSVTCGGGLGRDPSMSLEEFNKQVEAFIKKFNDNMRLQRQESEQRLLDMMRRGV